MRRIHISGPRYFRYDDPQPEQFTIEDIARGLAKEARYNGHCQGVMSVAAHSVLVSRLVPPELAFEGLMHDAPEAFCKDIPYDLKRALGAAYSEIEDRVWDCIATKYGLPLDMDHRVKDADNLALAIEKRDLKPDCAEDWGRTEGLVLPKMRVFQYAELHWRDAYTLFLNRARQLRPGIE